MEEKTLLKAVIVFPVRGNQILLARKMKHIGVGCWNGYGGGIEESEDAKDAALRELSEESGLEATRGGLKQIAIVDFHNQKSDGSVFTCVCDVFLAYGCDGIAKDKPEMRNPTWFKISALPFDEMMPADKEWLPPALQGKKIRAEAWYGPLQKELLRPTVIREIDSFD